MQCEGSLKTEYTKFEATHDKFCKDKAAHVQNFKGMANEAPATTFSELYGIYTLPVTIIHICETWSSRILGCADERWWHPG